MAGPYLSPLGPQADLLTEYMFGRRRQVSVSSSDFWNPFMTPPLRIHPESLLIRIVHIKFEKPIRVMNFD